MMNKSMQRKLETRECVDVSDCARTANGDYVLDTFNPDVDYCDAMAERWIWSIGKTLIPWTRVMMADGQFKDFPPGVYFASTRDHYYTMGESKVYECVWLR